jgi:hypothetical protein
VSTGENGLDLAVVGASGMGEATRNCIFVATGGVAAMAHGNAASAHAHVRGLSGRRKAPAARCAEIHGLRVRSHQHQLTVIARLHVKQKKQVFRLSTTAIFLAKAQNDKHRSHRVKYPTQAQEHSGKKQTLRIQYKNWNCQRANVHQNNKSQLKPTLRHSVR